jgi:hypothetical protein
MPRKQEAEDRQLTPDQYRDQLTTAESLSRKAESEANVFRIRQMKMPDHKGYQSRLKETDGAIKESAEEVERIRELAPPDRDPEGTRQTLSDKAGNFAPNAEVAGVGGVGMDYSNSASGGEQAADADSVEMVPTLGEQQMVGVVGLGGRLEPVEPAEVDPAQPPGATSPKAAKRSAKKDD